jgi:hypothetical protein
MRMLYSVLAAGALVVGIAGTGAAAPESFSNGTLSLQIATLDPLSLGPESGSADITRTGEAISSLVFPAGVFTTVGLVIPVTDPSAAPIGGLQATVSNQTGTFTGSPLAGPLAVAGVTKVCLFGACSAAVANLSVPFSNPANNFALGVGGTTNVTGAVNITVKGAPWTAGTINVDNGQGGVITAMGGVQQVGGGTQISLVTPVFISTNIGVSSIVPAFGTMQFTVPEPGAAAVGLAAVGSLLVLGRARRR